MVKQDLDGLCWSTIHATEKKSSSILQLPTLQLAPLQNLVQASLKKVPRAPDSAGCARPHSGLNALKLQSLSAKEPWLFRKTTQNIYDRHKLKTRFIQRRYFCIFSRVYFRLFKTLPKPTSL